MGHYHLFATMVYHYTNGRHHYMPIAINGTGSVVASLRRLCHFMNRSRLIDIVATRGGEVHGEQLADQDG